MRAQAPADLQSQLSALVEHLNGDHTAGDSQNYNAEYFQPLKQFLYRLVTNHARSPAIKLIGGANEPVDHEVNSLLVEDGDATQGVSYVDFLCKIHSLINHELSSSSIAERNAFLGFLQ